jgi:3-oxoacyl-[acyl-carrier protein] reductase
MLSLPGLSPVKGQRDFRCDDVDGNLGKENRAPMRLKDQVALVTGGSRGIGRAIVKAFAAEGAKVAFVFRGNKEAADSLAREIADAGGVVQAIQADVTSGDDAKKVVEGVIKAWSRVDILVNNAGIIRDDLFVRLEPDAWQAVLQTNLGGAYNFCRAVAYPMMKQRSGRIINVSSVAAEHVNPGQTNYAASKGAINSFTRALAAELASRNVTVNAVAPGFIETDMSAAVRNKAGELIKKMIPMRRLGQPEDIARVAVFLASSDAGYVTGQVLIVDGGLTLGAVAV